MTNLEILDIIMQTISYIFSSISSFIYFCFSVKSKTKVASNLWADTDEEDNADNPEAVKKNKDEQLDQQKNFAILAIGTYIYKFLISQEKLNRFFFFLKYNKIYYCF